MKCVMSEIIKNLDKKEFLIVNSRQIGMSMLLGGRNE